MAAVPAVILVSRLDVCPTILNVYLHPKVFFPIL